MSRSWVGFRGEASRNMVLQKGQAVATVWAPVAASSRARTWLTRASPFFFAEEGEAAAGSAAEAALVVAGGFDEGAGCGDDCAGLVVDVR